MSTIPTSDPDGWSRPPVSLSLEQADVHVWRARLDQPPAVVERLAPTLTHDERARSERFYFERDRASFVVARGVLRKILGLYIGRPPAQLRFCYGPRGKPALADGPDTGALRFNLSHSRGLALYAVTRGREVGVDIEWMRPDVATTDVARRVFSPSERATLHSLPVERQHEAFFNGWTRKEAFIKATGEGLSRPLDEFDVSIAPGEPACLLATQVDPREVSRWSLQELLPGPGYRAALVVEGTGWRLACWLWPDSWGMTGEMPE
jgi:4'-phosphopantetheinyl transferase